MLKAEGVMNRASAARVKLRCSATRRKALSCLEVKSTIKLSLTIIKLFELVS
jgi:hypothetical protein